MPFADLTPQPKLKVAWGNKGAKWVETLISTVVATGTIPVQMIEGKLNMALSQRFRCALLQIAF